MIAAILVSQLNAPGGRYEEMTASASSDQPASAVRTLVYLARHGQTPLNESGILRGLADPPLDEAGQRQARQLGAALAPGNPPS